MKVGRHENIEAPLTLDREQEVAVTMATSTRPCLNQNTQRRLKANVNVNVRVISKRLERSGFIVFVSHV